MKNFLKIAFVFLSLVFFSFHLYIKNFYFKGHYEDFLYYEVKNSQIYFKLYVDKFYAFYEKMAVGNYQKKYFSFWDVFTDYPANYEKFNEIQKKIIGKNFLLKFYIWLVAKNQIKIIGNIEIYNKDFKLPFYVGYLDNLKVQADLNFDKNLNIQTIKGSLKNEYLNLDFSFDKIMAKIGSEVFLGYLDLVPSGNEKIFQRLSLINAFLKINYNSFPVGEIRWEFKADQAYFSRYPYNIDLKNLKIEGNQKSFYGSSEQIILKNFNNKNFNYLTIKGLRSFFEINHFSKNLITYLKFGADMEFNKKIRLEKLGLETLINFDFDKQKIYFWIYKLKFKDIEGLNLNFLKKFGNYENFYNEISPNLWDKFSGIGGKLRRILESKTIKNLRIIVGATYFLLLNKDFCLQVEKQKIGFFHDQLFIYSYGLKKFLSFYKNEFLDLDLENGRIYFFSTVQFLYFYFREFRVFWTDYHSKVFLSKTGKILTLDINITKEETFYKFLSFLNLAKPGKILNNILIKNFRIKANEFGFMGIFSKNEAIFDFTLGKLSSFIKINNLVLKELTSNRLTSNGLTSNGLRFDGLTSKELIFRWVSPKKLRDLKAFVFLGNNYLVLEYSNLFVNFNGWFFYYEINIDKILAFYDFYGLVKNLGFFEFTKHLKSGYLNGYLSKILKGNNYLVFKKDFLVLISDKGNLFLAFEDLSRILGIKDHIKLVSLMKFDKGDRMGIFSEILIFWGNYVFQIENRVNNSHILIASQSILKIPLKKIFVFYKLNKKLRFEELERISRLASVENFIKAVIQKDFNLEMDLYQGGKQIVGLKFDSFDDSKASKLAVNFDSENLKDLAEILAYYKIFKDSRFLQVLVKNLQGFNSLIGFHFDNNWDSDFLDNNYWVFYLEDLKIQWDYLLRFSTKFSGMLKVDKYLNIKILSLDGEILNYNGVNLGNIGILYGKDFFKFKISLYRDFLDFVNLANILYFGDYELAQGDTKIEITFESNNGNSKFAMQSNFNVRELIFGNFRIKSLESNVDLNLVFTKDLGFNNLSKFGDLSKVWEILEFANFVFKANYYSKTGDIYRRSFQDVNLVFQNNKLILNGILNLSLNEIVKLINNKNVNNLVGNRKLAIMDEVFSSAFIDEVFNSAFIEVRFNNSTMGKKFDDLHSLKDFWVNTKVGLFFLVRGYEYFVEVIPDFNYYEGLVKIGKIRFLIYESYESVGELVYNLDCRAVDYIALLRLPSFTKSFVNYQGSLKFFLDFVKNEFTFDFENFSFKIFDNSIFIDNKLLVRRGEFSPPEVIINNSQLKIGFDGKFINFSSKLSKLDLGILGYTGNLNMVLLFKPNIIYGNIELEKGLIIYRKFNLKDNKFIPISFVISIKFDKVRFKNNFVDVIFSGNLNYGGKDNIEGKLTSRKGFVTMVDGMYRVLQAYLEFKNDQKPGLYAILQKFTSNIFEYKLSILKGNISDYNLEEFGFKTNNNNVNNDLSLNLYNGQFFDLISFSSKGYTVQREVLPNVFVSYFSLFNFFQGFGRLDYKWYYSVDWIVSRLKQGVISLNYREYSNSKSAIGFVFVKGF